MLKFSVCQLIGVRLARNFGLATRQHRSAPPDDPGSASEKERYNASEPVVELSICRSSFRPEVEITPPNLKHFDQGNCISMRRACLCNARPHPSLVRETAANGPLASGATLHVLHTQGLSRSPQTVSINTEAADQTFWSACAIRNLDRRASPTADTTSCRPLVFVHQATQPIASAAQTC